MMIPVGAPPGSLQTTVAARVADQLRREIRGGDLRAGTPLRQNDVAARLGVSSTPVREAFQVLEREGLVQRADRRGVVVFRPTLQDLISSYEIRAALEALAVRKAVAHLGAPDLDRLRELVAGMAELSVTDDAFMDLNRAFHRTISDAAHDRRLAELIAAEQTATTAYVLFLGVDEHSSEAAVVEHDAVYQALAAGDGEAAAAAMAAHLSARVDMLRARLAPTTDA
jgi:DNA-binding GntR family transcriptional regulator